MKRNTKMKMSGFKYRFREVKCPWCGHVFMWNQNSWEGLKLHEYKLKSTGEYVEKTKCPGCEMEMLVLERVFEGIDLDDKRVERIRNSL